MKLDALLARLAAGEIVALDPPEWEAHAPEFAVVEEHETGVAGVLRVVSRSRRYYAVEEAGPRLRAVRALASRAASRDFVRERMAAYDRLWDG